VLDDADLDRAAEVGVAARLFGGGQMCNGAKRFLVHQKIANTFLEKFTAILANTKIGDPMDESVGPGPLCSVSARDEIAAQVHRAVQAGATLHLGGAVVEGPGAYFQPTILSGRSRKSMSCGTMMRSLSSRTIRTLVSQGRSS